MPTYQVRTTNVSALKSRKKVVYLSTSSFHQDACSNRTNNLYYTQHSRLLIGRQHPSTRACFTEDERSEVEHSQAPAQLPSDDDGQGDAEGTTGVLISNYYQKQLSFTLITRYGTSRFYWKELYHDLFDALKFGRTPVEASRDGVAF